ncbi:MAG: choice-of-anchor D domain-containing protein, partial [Sphingomonas bacterium]
AAADGTTVSRVSMQGDGVSPAALAQGAPRLSNDARTIVFDSTAAGAFEPDASAPAASTAPAAPAASTGTHVIVVNRAPNVSIADADLGTVAVGYPGGEWFINVNNLGPTAFVPAKISTSNPNFGITGGTCTLGVAVPAGGKCEVHIILTPSVAGPVTGTLAVTEGGFGAVAVTSKLSGSGGEPVLASDHGGAGFGVVDVGKSAAAQSFTITNTGFIAANLTGAVLSGSNPADFKVAATTCSGLLDIGQACKLDVAFTPKTGGQRSAIVTVSTDAGQATTMLVGGEGRYTATMSTSSDRLFRGASFGIGGNGFPASTAITVLFGDGIGGSFTVTSNKQGAFLTSLTLATNERQGRRTLIARTPNGASAAVEVIVVGEFAQGAGPASALTPVSPMPRAWSWLNTATMLVCRPSLCDRICETRNIVPPSKAAATWPTVRAARGPTSIASASVRAMPSAAAESASAPSNATMPNSRGWPSVATGTTIASNKIA